MLSDLLFGLEIAGAFFLECIFLFLSVEAIVKSFHGPKR